MGRYEYEAREGACGEWTDAWPDYGIRSTLIANKGDHVTLSKSDGTNPLTFRMKPQPRYVTKNVQDVRVGDVVKDMGKVSIIHHYENEVCLFGSGEQTIILRPGNTVEVEVCD